MSTKFVSKNSNYTIVLRPGTEGSRALGTPTVPGLYVKFETGTVTIKEQEQIDMMRNHPGFGSDFIEVKDQEEDPYKETRTNMEPDHIHTEIKYGHAENRKASSHNVKVDPKLKAIIEREAIKMIPGILKANPEILKGILSGLKEESEKTEEAPTIEATTESPSDTLNEQKDVDEQIVPTVETPAATQTTPRRGARTPNKTK